MAGQKLYSPLNMNNLEIWNLIFQNLESAPETPRSGQVYFDTTTGKLMWRSATSWVDPLSRANHEGQQLASTISDFDTRVKALSQNQLNFLINTQAGTTYTLGTTDTFDAATGSPKLLAFTGSAPIAVTVPLNATAAIPVGSVILIAQLGTGAFTLAGESGSVILNTPSSLTSAGQYTPYVSLLKTGTDTWSVTGGLLEESPVYGPASATDNAIARFDATTGKLVQSSAVTIDDSGNITTPGTVDGRDISADGTKLDGVADSVTTLQTSKSNVLVTTNEVTGTSYDLQSSDLDKLISMNSASNQTLNIRLNSAHAIAVGFNCVVARIGTGTVTIAPAGGVTVSGNTSVTSTATLIKTGTDTWFIESVGENVLSFAGRTGSVVGAAGDYTTTQVTNTSTVVGATTTDALNTLQVNKADVYISTNTVTGSVYSLASTDLDKLILMNSGSAQVLTIRTNANHIIPTGFNCTIKRLGVGTVTLSPEGGVTITGPTTVVSTVTLIKTGTDSWLVESPADTSTLITNASTVSGTTVTDALNTLNTGKADVYVVTTSVTTASYDLPSTDVGRLLACNSASAQTINIRTNASHTIATGFNCVVKRLGSGSVTIVPAVGVSVTGFTAVTGSATLIKTGTDTWVIESSVDPVPLTNSAPAMADKSPASPGLSTEAARADHKHDFYTATAVAVAATSTEGVSNALARADHTHAGVTSWAGRQGAVTATSADITNSSTVSGAAVTDALNTLNTTKSNVYVTTNDVTGASYDLASTDLDKLLTMNSGANQTLNIRLNSVHAITTGFNCVVKRVGAGTVTIVPAGGVTVTGPLTVTGSTTLIKTGTDTWISETPEYIVVTNTAPTSTTKATAVVGLSPDAARADHKHDIVTAAPVSIGAANAEGTSTSLARADHVHASGGVTVSAGAADAGKLILLNGSGKLDSTVLPPNGAISNFAAGEALAAGDFVSIKDAAGTPKAFKANASTKDEAHGYVLAAFSSGATAAVYFDGINTLATGLAIGPVYLSATGGLGTATAPITAGHISQMIGLSFGSGVKFTYSLGMERT